VPAFHLTYSASLLELYGGVRPGESTSRTPPPAASASPLSAATSCCHHPLDETGSNVTRTNNTSTAGFILRKEFSAGCKVCAHSL